MLGSKTHAMCAIGHRLVQSGRSVLFIPAYRLVQDMLAAKRDLDLPRMLRKLDNYDLLVIDDLGYLPQGAEESEVLFTLIAERYERRSLGITSNLVFSEWEKVFSNPMATAAAIDRIVHHSVILEFDMPSYRTSEAQGRQAQERQLQTTITPWRVVRRFVGMNEATPSGQSNWRKAAIIVVVDHELLITSPTRSQALVLRPYCDERCHIPFATTARLYGDCAGTDFSESSRNCRFCRRPHETGSSAHAFSSSDRNASTTAA